MLPYVRMVDRFNGLVNLYDQLFEDVWADLGLSYRLLQESVFKEALENYSDLKNARVLDIGCGTGDTLLPFVKYGCKNLTGVDVNPEMVNLAKEKISTHAKILQCDARDLKQFSKGDFDIVISAAAIHNIENRNQFWGELKRIEPKLFVTTDKIAYESLEQHQKNYAAELGSIVRLCREKYHSEEMAQHWINHYEDDEKMRLSMNEINDALGKEYCLSIKNFGGMMKILFAKKK